MGILPARSLGSRQAEVVGWLEAERRRSITSREVMDHFAWAEPTASNVLSDLAKKHWLRRVARGIYEFLPAETGGFQVDDPWPALAGWKAKHYVAFRSAAYQHGLTPDRPGRVQVAVPVGVHRPRAWGGTPIVLLHQRDYSEIGVQLGPVSGWQVRFSGPERTTLDGAIQPKRMGGIPELARVLARAHRNLDWSAVSALATKLRRGRIGLRRLGALAELLELPMPNELEDAVGSARSRLYLGDTSTYGSAGPVLTRWNVVDNVGPGVRAELNR
jgi:predicted transcriptional regulator of viral defense system